MKEGENGPVTATLTRTGSIRGRVVLPDGSAAQGIEVHAFGSGQGLDNGQGNVRTAADGSYEMDVNAPDKGYAVYVDDKEWAARSRLDVVVATANGEGLTSSSRPDGSSTAITVGPGNPPAVKQYIRLDETGAKRRRPREREITNWRPIRRQFGAITDSAGRFSIRVGPGTFTLMGPPRTVDEKITLNAEIELVRNFRMPRPEKGTLTGRVVLAGTGNKGIAAAKIQIAAVNRMSIPFAVTAEPREYSRPSRQPRPSGRVAHDSRWQVRRHYRS